MLYKLQRKTLIPSQIVGYALTLLVGMSVVPSARCLSRDGLDWAMAAISDIDIESLPFIWTVWTVIHFTRRGDVY